VFGAALWQEGFTDLPADKLEIHFRDVLMIVMEVVSAKNN
jgi:hypothetical protein